MRVVTELWCRRRERGREEHQLARSHGVMQDKVHVTLHARHQQQLAQRNRLVSNHLEAHTLIRGGGAEAACRTTFERRSLSGVRVPKP